MLRILFVILAAIGFVACGNSDNPNEQNTVQTEQTPTPTPTATPASSVKNGQWGGQGISLTVADPESSFELDCAHGKITDELVTDASGRFSARGVVTQEHGGPVHPGEHLPSYDAQFDGTVVGDVMNLRIRYESANGSSDTSYRLVYRAQPVLHKCL